MGVLANVKQFVAKKAAAAAVKAADGIAAASQLSPRQIAEMEDRRQSYLARKPDMTDTQAQTVVQRNLGAIGIEVYQEYLARLKDFYRPVNLAAVNFDPLNRIRFFDITKWVSVSDEQCIDKLVSVYHVLSAETCNVALIYHRTVDRCSVTLAVANTDADQSDPAQANAYLDRLIGALKGNFPGIEIRQGTGKSTFGSGLPESLQSAVRIGSNGPCAKSVAAVSNLASEKSKEFISQTMEKLLDNGVVPRDDSEAYTIVLLASPVLNPGEKKNRLFEIATALSPYASWQTNYTYTDSEGLNAAADAGAHLGANAGGQVGNAHTDGSSHKKLSAKGDGSHERDPIKAIGKTLLEGVGMMARPTLSESEAHTMGFQAGINFGVQFSRSSNVNAQVGMNEGVGQTFTNYAVQHALKMIDNQVKRLDESSALGMWEFAAYVISDSPKTAADAAHTYFSLTQGEESYMTEAAIHLWDGQREKGDALPILESIQKIQHPVFSLTPSADGDQLMYPTLVTPSACVTGRELARALNFPRKSISGLPVLEGVSFGREVHRYGSFDDANREIIMGHIQHMRQTERTPVTLDVDSLTSHVFITGTTNSGKSNTVYQMLDKLREHGVKFLVIEPAKGEYKKIFGGTSRVYGTNSDFSELLSINPFSFPENISVTEHIDRLIEIFNACWPMYAAMPAILKDAVEQSYERVGWDLTDSRCSPRQFPTFEVLIDILPQIIASSPYSSDTKSDYTGALVTRVRSLTNGVNGQIFCGKQELTCEDLFENDVIIDLSRPSSAETKALMMGIIVMKLQEYRIHLNRMNAELLHVTVLEEAHNLLRKTSVNQVQESANLQGQSVRMLSDSIAEMRTYGEGFFIADQAPCLLDEAVIRNTNTKIVLRLPDQADRQVVGASMALNEQQITELAKLPRGTAAIYQSDWVEPVLCQVERFPESKASPLKYTPKEYRDERETFIHFFKKLFGVSEEYELSGEDVDAIKEWIKRLRKSTTTKKVLNAAAAGHKLTREEQRIVAYNLFDGAEIAKILMDEQEEDRAIEKVNLKIASYLQLNNAEITDHVRNLVLQAIFREGKNKMLEKRYLEFLDDGRFL